MADPRPIDPEELLEHTGWLRSLARGLVHDDATAEDLVQQACTAAIEHPPQDRRSLGAWLGGVVRHLAARVHRDRARRERRERRVARPERETPDVSEVLERAELARQVMDLVLELDEPFRSTVLLRYHEQLPPEAVARRLGVPLSTVGTRLHRALERLRERLDRESGGRRAWVALLAPWAGLAAAGVAASSAAGAAGGVSGSAATGTGVATGTSLAAGTQSLSGGALLGGVLVMQKAIITGVVVCTLSLAAGYGIGRTTAPETGPAEGERIVATAEYEDLVERESRTTEELETLRAERAAWREERKSIVARAERAETALASANAAAPDPTLAEPTTSSMVVAFGDWGDLPELRDADWAELAATVIAINDLVLPLVEDLEQGNPVSPATQMSIQEQNQKLVKHGVSMMEKLPSNAAVAVNGEFTHPVNLINLIAGMLQNAGVPLSPGQLRELAAIGSAYEAEWSAMNATYDETTWQLTKIVDELELKRDTMLEVEERLTPSQLSVVAVPKIQNRLRLDTLSPVNMVVMHVGPMQLDDASELPGEVVEGLRDMLAIPEEALAENEDLIARFAEDVAILLETPVQREMAPFVRIDDIVTAGRAFERLLMDLAARIQPSDDLLASLRSVQGWAVPERIASATP